MFVRHPNKKIREHYQAIIHNLLAIANQDDTEELCLRFCGGRYEDILHMFMEEIEDNKDDEEALVIIMESLRCLVHYGDEGRKQHLLLEDFERRGAIRVLEV